MMTENKLEARLPPSTSDHISGDLNLVRLPHLGRWAVSAVLILIVATIAKEAITSPNMRWDVVGQYMFDIRVMKGLLLTLELTVLAMLVSVVLGILLAIMRLSKNPVMLAVSWCYVYVFRGVPVLVQVLIWYFMAAVFPQIGITIPFGPTLFSVDTTKVIGQMGAAVLALGLSAAAYMCENARAGILSISRGQHDAAAALGMPPQAAFFRIILPQSMRVIVPMIGNQFIGMLKETSLVFAIALPELLTAVQLIYTENFLQIPLLTVACVWYLFATGVLTVIQRYVERHYGRGIR